MKREILVLIAVFVSFIRSDARVTDADKLPGNNDKHFFIENRGQWPSEVLYLARIGELNAWVTKNGILYDFYELDQSLGISGEGEELPNKVFKKEYTITGHKVWYKFQGSNELINTEGLNRQAGYYNYLIGNDPGKHASNVGLYKEVVLKNVYNGIDIRYYFDDGNIRFDYIVNPGADPSQISFDLGGTDHTFLNFQGDLVFNTCFGQVAFSDLYSYQGTRDNKIVSSFIKTEKGWTIAVGEYNRNQTLIIDPLIYSTFAGGGYIDVGQSIAIDASGNTYVTGITASVNFDTTSGAYKTKYSGSNYDIFVMKMNSTGSQLIFSTYIGGNGEDQGISIDIDTSRNVYVTGFTASTDFNATSGAYRTSFSGGYDAFVLKLNSSGTRLIYSTYLGGSSEDQGFALAVDNSGSAYIAGTTQSVNYDTTSGAYQTFLSGLTDAFITKLNAAGTSLIYSTYLGGNNHDNAAAIALDASGNIFVTGSTRSYNFDTTAGAYKTSWTFDYDAYVTKLNSTGTALIYSTYLGGNSYDYAYGIAINSSGNAFVTGTTASTNFKTTPGAFKTSFSGGYSDVFVTKINTKGTGLTYSTYLGGNAYDLGNSIAVDNYGHAYLTGYTISNNFDTTAGAFKTKNNNGESDAFVTRINATGSSLVYSTCLGGSGADKGISAAVDASYNVFVTGYTQSTNFLTTAGAYKTKLNGGYDLYISRICLDGDLTVKLSSGAQTDTQILCVNTAINEISYLTTNAKSASITGLPQGVTGKFASNVFTINGTPLTSGTFSYTIFFSGNCRNIISKGVITVNPAIPIVLNSSAGTDSQSLCINTAITEIVYSSNAANAVVVTGLPSGLTVSIKDDLITINGTPTSSGVFEYTLTNAGACGNLTAKGIITVIPQNAIDLISGTGTDSQTLCINTTIIPIEYKTTDTSRTIVTGLPSGLNYRFDSDILTISGTPSESGLFSYSVILTGKCGAVLTQGSIMVNIVRTIKLFSSSGTDSQVVCNNTPISNIVYTAKNTNGVTFNGLPDGVTGNTAAGNGIVISGTPKFTGTYSYTISIIGVCGMETVKGSIIVKPDNSLNLTSAPGTDMQNVKVNNPISDIKYSTTNASGAAIKGLPAGVSGIFSADTVTISGTPTEVGTFNYTISLTEGCGKSQISGRIVVEESGSIKPSEMHTLIAYPNPSDTELEIKGDFNSLVKVEITDALGRVCKVEYSSDDTILKLRVSELEIGVYFVKITDGGQVYQCKIIVEH